MINTYPVWKNVVVFFIFIIGCVYLLPNLYEEHLVVLVSKNFSYNKNPDNALLSDIKKILKNEKIISKSIILDKDDVKICFFYESDQLCCYKRLSSVFSKKFLVSYKKVSSVPNWLHLIQANPIQLGLDLKGGLYLILRVETMTVLNKLQEQYIDILKSALIKENIPYIKIRKINNYDIEVIFNNSDYRNQSILYLSKIYKMLHYHIVDTNTINIVFSKNYINTICEDTIQKNSVILRHRMHQLKIYDFTIQRYGWNCIAVELPGVQDVKIIKSILSNTTNLEFRLVNTNIKTFEINNNLIPDDSEIKLNNNGDIVPLYKQVILAGNHIINSDVHFDEYCRPTVNVWLDNYGSEIISKFTKNNIGKLMAALFVEYKNSGKLDFQGNPILYKCDKVISMAVIQSQLMNSFCISGFNNINEARYLSSLLKMGSLYSPVYIEEERIIGPILGKKNVVRGMIVCGLGVLLSICFMVIWYRYFGLIAGIALIVNLILIISLMSIIPGVVLTMPGIAGIVLTLSVAIDSNVLINERIKEEIRRGKPIQYSIYMGYRKSFNSIVDSNITTIIISTILYCLGTGSIKGFAMVTIIGVGTSMFTSIVGTRAIVNLVYGKKYLDKLSI